MCISLHIYLEAEQEFNPSLQFLIFRVSMLCMVIFQAIFGDFRKKTGTFFKTNDPIQFLQNLVVIIVKNVTFPTIFFDENILKIIISAPS
jgi:hypothetical protein